MRHTSSLHKLYKRLNDQNNRGTRVVILVVVIGLLFFLVASFTLPFNKGLFSQLFNKPNSSAMTISSNCGLNSPAFCDDFSTPHPGGRAGDLDDSKWSFYRDSQIVNLAAYANLFAPTDAQ